MTSIAEITEFSPILFAGLVEQLYLPKEFLRSQIISSTESTEDTFAEYHFSEDSLDIADFCDPEAQANNIKIKPFTIKRFMLPLIKDKFTISAYNVQRNIQPGYTRYANRTLDEKATYHITKQLRQALNRITRSTEKMIAEAIQTGKIAITGNNINAEIDFEFPSDHLITLTGTNLWTDTASDPIKDLRTWYDKIMVDSGVRGNIVCIVGSDVANILQNNDTFAKALDNRRYEIGLLAPQQNTDGSCKLGSLNDPAIMIYRYNEVYKDKTDGTIKQMIDPKKVILFSREDTASLYYGGIPDFAATDSNKVAVVDTTKESTNGLKCFIKPWEQEDPSVRHVLCSSSVCPIITRPKAFLCAKVIA